MKIGEHDRWGYPKPEGISKPIFICPNCGRKSMYYSYSATMYICEGCEHSQVETPITHNKERRK